MVNQARTRKQIRPPIGYNLDALYVSACSAQGTTSTIVDSSLALGSADDYLGKWILFTSGDNDGKIRRVTDMSITSNVTTLTVMPAVTQTEANDTYEMWDEAFPPARIHDFIDQAFIAATGKVYDDEESVALHADSVTSRFDIPTEFAMLKEVLYRRSYDGAAIHAADSLFDETTDANFTQALDTKDRKSGNSSLKMTVAAGASANDKVTDVITSLDLSKYTHVEFWAKSTVAAAAADLAILLDDTAACASPLETLTLPALTADTWTFCRVALANPETDTAIISVGIQYTTDLGACVIWFDDIKAVVDASAVWDPLPRGMWSIDKSARDLVLTGVGRSRAGYRLLKLKGGDKPALMTADTDTSEIDDEYVIARATALGFASVKDGNNAGAWMAVSNRAMRAFPILANVRTIS